MNSLASLLKDPPPAYAFELSEAGIAFARMAEPAHVNFTPFEAGVLLASPAHDNLHQPQVVQERIRALVPSNGHRKRRAALILPDYCARVAVLDFDNFPTDQQEQVALLRFRMRKSVPFDIDSAVVSYVVQTRAAGAKVEVLAALMGADVVARYEAPFRTTGFHPGMVTTSSLAALNLCHPEGITMLVKISGRVLSVLVLDGSTLKLARYVETDEARPDEIEAVLHPTVAYIEDELKSKPQQIWVCGFGPESADLARQWNAEWGVQVQPLRSRFGAPGRNDAGLLGYLESAAN
jgi:type IV pilus assembly protein PilM